MCFFFQAEDGIRDIGVTGVQTCALPISDDAIRALVEKSGVPFLPMSMAKGLLPDTHPQCAGAARSTVLKDSDVVMLIGARLNWLLSHGKGKAWGTAPKKFIQIDIEPREMDSNVEIRSEEHTSELQS